MGPGEFLNINFFTALFTLVNTIILILVMKKFLWKPVLKMITDRQKEIDDIYENADKTRQEADAMKAEYEQKLAEAAVTGEKLVKDAVARGQSREEEILRSANARADAILQKASEDIAREKRKAVNDAKSEIADLAMEIAGKVVGQSLDGKDQSDLVDRFIDGLGEG